MSNVGIFIDLVNQYYAVNKCFRGRKIDFEKYLLRAENEGEIYRAFAYGAQISDEAHPFITKLKSIGYEPRYVQAVQVDNRANIRATDRTDDLVNEIAHMLERLDIVIIGSSNPELRYVLEFIRGFGRKTIIFAADIPKELKDYADFWWPITEKDLEVPETT